MARTTWSFHSAGGVLFGWGSIRQLRDQVRERNWRRVAIVTDPALVKAGLLDKIQQPLVDAPVELFTFTQGEPEPRCAVVESCVAALKPFGPDAIVGLGGGSNMDLAKIASVVLKFGGTVRDYVGENKVPGVPVPVVCIPTTAGTGSEVTASGVVTDESLKLKVGVLSQFMRPALAVVDPEMSLNCPRQVTADSGIDALVHAIEAYTAVDNEEFPLPPGEKSVYQGRNVIGTILGEEAIRLVGQHLKTAVNTPNSREAREGMALAATLAGLAFSNVGVALVHAMEYPVGGAVHVSHGMGNGILLPYVMKFNRSTRPTEFARLARLLGAPCTGDIEHDSHLAIAAVEELKRAIGIPESLRQVGVSQSQLADFADKASRITRILRVNPRFPTWDEILEIFQQAF